jgi:hypothetical protein
VSRSTDTEAIEALVTAYLQPRLARAWDEGMRTGSSRAMRRMSDEPGLPLASTEDNPYLSYLGHRREPGYCWCAGPRSGLVDEEEPDD